MKDIPIKFRGVRLANNAYIYGDLRHGESGVVYIDGWRVQQKSVSQLIGYDCDGKEIYEGDKLVSAGGIEFKAELWSMGVNTLDADAIEGGIFNFRLKSD